MLDLLKTGKYGVLANQKFLGTTSNNISNVNTTGYTRQDTQIYTNVVEWGIGQTYTRRMYNQYVQREMFRDQGNVGYYDAYKSGMDTVDGMLSDDSMSISSSLNSYFSALQDAVQNPTSTATRRELLSQLDIMIDRYQTLNYNIQNELHDVNAQIDDTVTKINSLVYGIYEVNRQISYEYSDQTDTALQLMDKRDQLINELSNYVDINTTIEDDGSISVYLGNGQMLVTQDAYAILESSQNELDPSRRDVSITFSTNDRTNITVNYEGWGGKLGGLLESTDDIRQTMRDLGQLAIAFADAMNEQNKAGITLDGVAGKDLITIPSVAGVTTDSSLAVTATFKEGKGANVSADDFYVNFDKNGNMAVYIVENGEKKELSVPDDFTETTDANGNLVLDLDEYGITLTFNKKKTDIKDVKALVQPTMHAAYNIKSNITKPEDFAFASSVTVNTGDNNAGNATISFGGVSHQGDDYGVSIDNTEFLPDGTRNPNYQKPKFNDGAPTKIVVDDNGDFQIQDSDGNVLGYAPAECDGQNIFANATWNDPTLGKDYPGYEVSITGTFETNDSFELIINENGVSDNSNGVLLGHLQSADVVRSTKEHKVSFTEGYADILSTLGSAIMEADTNLQAASAKCEKTQELYASCAGVNLDEEAANLVRFQQSYTSCSKIIAASQTIFDALINAI